MLNICLDGREIPRKCQSAVPEPQVHIRLLMAAKLLRCCISSETTEAQSPFPPQQGQLCSFAFESRGSCCLPASQRAQEETSSWLSNVQSSLVNALTDTQSFSEMMYMQRQVCSVRTSCLEMPFGKAEIRLKNRVCTEAQNIIKFEQIFNGNAKKKRRTRPQKNPKSPKPQI